MCHSPAPTVSWSRVAGTLSSGRYNTSHYDTQLTIRNVSMSDAGVYECSGSNSLNTARHRIHLDVAGQQSAGLYSVCLVMSTFFHCSLSLQRHHCRRHYIYLFRTRHI